MDTKEVSIGDAICLGLDERPAVKDPPRTDFKDKHSEEVSRKQEKNRRVGEIREFRGPDRKIYRMSDGSEQAVFYPAPIHVFDEETQSYESVEHTLTEEEDGRYFVCEKNNFTARFSREDNSDELFSIARGACRVTVSARKNRNNRNKGVMPVLRKEERAGGFADILSYANTEPGADYEYSVEGNGVKENIVVKEKAAVYRYPFTLYCENVTAQFHEEKNQITFLSEETGEEVFYIPSPFMSDANGVLSTAVTYEMKNMENGVVHLTVTADADFMNAEGRAFPVVIDPQIHLSGVSAMTTYSWQDGYMYSAASHEIGTTGNGDGPCNGKRMYIHFNMPTLPRNPRIKKAELVFTQASFSTGIGDSPKFGLYTVTSGISLGNNTPVESSELIDYAKMNLSANGRITYTFDVTTLIDRICGTSRYYPQDLVLKTIDEDAPVNVGITLFGSSYLANEEYAPKFVITYETSYGVNTSYRTHTHEIGRFGQGSVDLQTRNLMFEFEDFSWAGNRLPVTIKHLYNSALADYPYTQNTGIMLNTADFSAMSIGYGFKLNVMQSMRRVNTTHNGYEVHFVYIGENGEEVYFKESNECVCLDDNSQCYKLYEDVDSGSLFYDPNKCTLTQGDLTYHFDPIYGRLFKIEDGFHNHMDITYTGNRITSVTDGAGREFGFAYNSAGKLTSISAPDDTYITYVYDGYLLKRITYPDNSRALFTYLSNKPASVTVVSSAGETLYRVEYTFSGDCMTGVTEYGLNDTLGAKSTYSHSAASARTIVTTTEQMDPEEGETANNVIQTVYAFDYDGNVVSEYVTSDDTGSGAYNGAGSGVNPYAGGGNVGVAASINNLLVNHSFNDLSGWQPFPNNSIYFDYGTRTYAPYSHFGTSALRMCSTSVATYDNGVYQTVDALPAGQYAFSVYLRSFSNFGDASQVGVCIRVVDMLGNILAVSERIAKKDSQYVRLVAPFELKAETGVHVQIVMRGKGTVYADGAQLERNPYANPYNLIENNSFEQGLSWWGLSGLDVRTPSNTGFNMDKALALFGDLDAEKYVYQEPSVRKSRSTRETFTLSGWAKGYALPNHDRDGVDTPPVFRLRAEVVYSDSTENFTADFQPCTKEWQFASVQFSKSQFKYVEAIRVYCEYNYNSGTAYFDDIQFVRDNLETGLTASDFVLESTDYDESSTEETVETIDSAPLFEEKKDAYGNVLTETTFTDGEFGTIYRAFAYNADDDCLTGNDAGNNLIAEADARGNVTQYTVDCVTSRNTEVTDRCGNKTAYEYDRLGRTTKVTSHNTTGDAQVSYTYDYFGNMTEILRGDGMKYNLAYNEFHNLQSIDVDGFPRQLIQYSYKNGNGRLKQIKYANGDYMKTTYNSIGQMMSETWYNQSDVEIARYKYAYDVQGNIVRSIDIFQMREYNYTYEEGRLIRATESEIASIDGEIILQKTLINTIRYYYDNEGKLLKKVLMPEGGTEQTIFYDAGEDNTVAKFNVNGRTVTAHSKTDSFGRKVFDEIQLGTGYVSRQFYYHTGNVSPLHTVYEKVKSAPTTHLVSQITLSDDTTLLYAYDNEERITQVTEITARDGNLQTNTTHYSYDALGQLTEEMVNGTLVNTVTYDNYGNIQTKNGKQYSYHGTWRDLLICYDGQEITYDHQGNPLSYLGHTLTWEKGRQLKSYDGYTYTYNANGIRTSKTANGATHNYVLDGTKILRETWNGNVLTPLYDNEDSVLGILYNNTPYYFQKNLQGDVIAILNQNAQVVVRYSYDAWGMPTILQDSSNCFLAITNPYLYRGYYFDFETLKYYLQSRYYDPVTGRFINADEAGFMERFGTATSYNLFSYCSNAPVNMADIYGYKESPVYSGIVGFGVQILISANVLCYQGFLGFEALWFAFTKNNNFGNSLIPWCYWFAGGSLGLTLDFKVLLSKSFINNPKNVLQGFGLGFSISLGVTFFLITANRMEDPKDYTRSFTFSSITTWGITVSKASGSNISTYGIGFAWEVGASLKKVSIGKKLFGTAKGASYYWALPINRNAQELYSLVKSKV